MGNVAITATRGIVLTAEDEVTQSRARGTGLAITISPVPILPFPKTLLVEAGSRVPFDLIGAAWGLLDRWDIAVPLWRYGETAASVGTSQDRAKTSQLVRDLRVPLHSYELLFAREAGAGKAFVETWREEWEAGGDKRHAFLRALHRVKPMACILPTTWLATVRRFDTQPGHTRGAPMPSQAPLVRVQVSPGRFIQVRAGDEERALENFRRTQQGRAGRR